MGGETKYYVQSSTYHNKKHLVTKLCSKTSVCYVVASVYKFLVGSDAQIDKIGIPTTTRTFRVKLAIK